MDPQAVPSNEICVEIGDVQIERVFKMVGSCDGDHPSRWTLSANDPIARRERNRLDPLTVHGAPGMVVRGVEHDAMMEIPTFNLKRQPENLAMVRLHQGEDGLVSRGTG
jgi:hypothetical protein